MIHKYPIFYSNNKEKINKKSLQFQNMSKIAEILINP